MNKDVVSIIFIYLYRKHIEEISEIYRENYCRSGVTKDSIFYRATGWQLNYRNLQKPRIYNNTNVYNFIKRQFHLIKFRKY